MSNIMLTTARKTMMATTIRRLPGPVVPRPVRTARVCRSRVSVGLNSDLTSHLLNFNIVVGKGIVLFTLFYCTLNWAFYRELRLRNETKRSENQVEKEDDT